MFGQPASSQTVCSVRLAHQALRLAVPLAEVRPHPHPLGAPEGGVGHGDVDAGGREPSEQAHGLRRVYLEWGHRGRGFRGRGGERRRVDGHGVAPRHVLALDRLDAEVLGEAGDDRGRDRLHRRRVAEQPGQRRDALVADPARHDVAEHGEVGVDVEGEAVARPPAATFTPMAATFSSPTHTPVRRSRRSAPRTPRSPSASMSTASSRRT